MNAPSVDIKTMLDNDSSLGLTFKTDLFVGREPKTPHNCVTVFDASGNGVDSTLNKTELYHRTEVQIRVRNNSYVTGYALASAIQNYLLNQAQTTVGGTLYTVIKSRNDIFLLDWDDNNNARFIINLEIQRR